MSPYDARERRIRLRTHYWIDQRAVETVLAAVHALLS